MWLVEVWLFEIDEWVEIVRCIGWRVELGKFFWGEVYLFEVWLRDVWEFNWDWIFWGELILFVLLEDIGIELILLDVFEDECDIWFFFWKNGL